jgi:hypothetical protein
VLESQYDGIGGLDRAQRVAGFQMQGVAQQFAAASVGRVHAVQFWTLILSGLVYMLVCIKFAL